MRCRTAPHFLFALPNVFGGAIGNGKNFMGELFGAKTPPMPSRNVGAFRSRAPSRQNDSRPFRGRQSCRFLETGSLYPPLAALRLFPPHPLTTQRQGFASPRLWKPPPRIRTAAALSDCAGRFGGSKRFSFHGAPRFSLGARQRKWGKAAKRCQRQKKQAAFEESGEALPAAE